MDTHQNLLKKEAFVITILLFQFYIYHGIPFIFISSLFLTLTIPYLFK